MGYCGSPRHEWSYDPFNMFRSDQAASDEPGAPLIELRANLAGRVDIVTLKLFLAVV